MQTQVNIVTKKERFKTDYWKDLEVGIKYYVNCTRID